MKIRLIFFLVLLAFLSMASQASTVTVCPIGCNYKSIQTAINSADPGDTIEVHSGRYSGDIILTKDVEIHGTDTPILVGNIYTNGNSLTIGGIFVTGTLFYDGKGSLVISRGTTLKGGMKPGKISENLEESNGLIYSADFKRWGLTESAGLRSYVQNNKLHIELSQSDKFASSYPTEMGLNNFIIEVNATQEGGTSLGISPPELTQHVPIPCCYGVVLRKRDDDNYYRFLISDLGYYNFDKTQYRSFKDIIPWTESSAINKGTSTNRIKVECRGNRFTFYVNDIKLNECIDNTFNSGNIGLGIETNDISSIGTVHVSFEDLKVWAV